MIGAVTGAAVIAKRLVLLGRALDRLLALLGRRCCVARSQERLDRVRGRAG